MSSATASPTVRRFVGDLAAAITGSLLTLPTSIGYGLILFGALGPNAAAAGLAAVLTTVIVGGAVAGLLSATRGLAVGGSSSIALLLAGLVAGIATEGAGADQVAHALALVIAASLLAGLFLGSLALLGSGKLAQLMPYPVVAGIVNGTAVLMMLSMARHATGYADGASGGEWHPGAMLVAALVLALMLLPQHPRLRSVPPVLVAVLAGTALQQLLLVLAGQGFVGPELGALPSLGAAGATWVAALEWLPKLRPATLLLEVLPVAASIAVLAMLETLSTAAALNETRGQQADSKRDLVATAAAMLASGAAGGMAPSGSIGSTMTMHVAGAQTRLALPLRSLLLTAGCLLLGQVIGHVPMAVLAGVVISGAVMLLDLGALRAAFASARGSTQYRGDIFGSAAVMLAVTGIAVHWSLLSAVAVGLLLALMVFAASMARDVVRRSYHNPTGRSRIRRNDADTALLLEHGGRIVVIELEGAIFFGSADRVAAEVQAVLDAGAQYVILDLRRVSRVDQSGARRLLQACNRFWRQGVQLSLAYVRPGLVMWDYLSDLRLLAELRQEHVFGSLDAAVEAAEAALLRALDAAGQDALSPEQALRLLSIPEASVPALLAQMQRVSLAEGEVVIRVGEQASEVLLLLSGLLDVTLPLSEGDLRVRLATLAPGALVGEMALLSGQPRSADVVARQAAECLRFEVATMDRLRREQPDLAYQLLLGITMQIQQNLRQANVTINNLEQ